MKICPQCGRTFSNLVKQCPACGRDLGVENEDKTIKDDIPTPPPTPQPTPTINPDKKTGNFNLKNKIIEMEQKAGWYNKWFGTIIVIISLLVNWYVDIDLGAVLAIPGIIIGWPSSNNVNKAISVIGGAISICMVIFTYMLL